MAMAKSQNTNNMKSVKCQAGGILPARRWERRMVRPLWKRVWQFLTKLNTGLAVELLGVYSEERKTYILMKTCT